MKRLICLIAAGAALLTITYLARQLVVDQQAPPEEWREDYRVYATASERSSELAQVQIWSEAPPGYRSYWKAKNAARFIVIAGEAFVDDVHLPNERIREYLDLKVKNGEIKYVVISPVKGSKWGEIFPVVDECRKSRVEIVLLNQNEA